MNDVTNKDIQRNLQFRNVDLRSLKILPGEIRCKLNKKNSNFVTAQYVVLLFSCIQTRPLDSPK